MTPTDRRIALAAIGWTQRGLADRLGWDEGTVRRWMRDGGEAPAEVDAWLGRVAAFHQAHPPPGKIALTKRAG
jgi:transcriptional regulator with XRE-family HTH domain